MGEGSDSTIPLSDLRLGEIETALAALHDRPVKYDPEEIARAGAFVSIDGSGELRVERGYVRPEDEPALPRVEPATDSEMNSAAATSALPDSDEVRAGMSVAQEQPEEEEGIKPIPDRLMTELTAF